MGILAGFSVTYGINANGMTAIKSSILTKR